MKPDGVDLRDPELAEQFEAEHPDEAMRRRDFLGRTAALAGGAALAGMLPPDELVRAAARFQGRVKLPSPRNMPIDTFVVLMMENRSFDHYFGWHPKADGRNAGLVYPDAAGNPVATHHLTPDFQGCDFRDPDHGWNGGRHQYGGGQMNGFVQGNQAGDGSDSFAAGYYLKSDLDFIPHAAGAFQLYDRFFCSIMASTYPNRHYMWSAQSGGQKSNIQQANSWETIFDRAASKGVSGTYFNSDLPVSALYGPKGLAITQPIGNYYTRAAAGNLPNISYVDPPFKDGGGGDGVSADEHPHGDVRLGQAFMSDVVHAFIDSPQFKRGALFIVYDEWGGFFDHARPHFVPDDRRSRDLYEDFGMTGFRVPAVVVSPYVKRGRVNHASCTFESILKLISYRFGLGALNKRHRYAFNIGRTFDWNSPNFNRPDIPDPQTIAATPCSLQRPTGRRKPHDLVDLETSGFLDRMGYEVKKPTYSRIFRNPDSFRRALRQSTQYR
ncbi:MAG: alkaline phosphatase family protein [Actinomycetota bacterium]